MDDPTMDWVHPPSYGAATFVYAIQVDALSLIYHARAYDMQKPARHFIAACRRGGVQCSPDERVPVTDLPPEVYDTIAGQLSAMTLKESKCQSWLYHGEEAGHYHPKYCCSPEIPPENEWPARVFEAFSAARDYFTEHFTVAIPRCRQPCSEHHVCKVIYNFLRRWGLALADCPMEGSEEQWNWLVALAAPPEDMKHSLIEHSISLDTDHTVDIPFRTVKKIAPDWQERQTRRKDDIMRFRRESGVVQKADAEPEPEFFLVCLCERLE